MMKFGASRADALGRSAIWRIVGLFGLFGVAWIVLPDGLFGLWVTDHETLIRLQLIKGWTFILANGVLLFLVLRREARRTREAQAALDRLGRERQAVFESALDPMMLVDDGTAIADVNAAAVEVLAGPEGRREQVVGVLLADCMTFNESLPTSECKPGDAVLRRPGLEPRLVRFSITPAITQDHHLVVLQDVTAERRLEQERRQAQTLDAIGRLAAGVAHDFNNLLTVIFGQIDLAMMAGELPGHAPEALAEIRRCAKRGATLTRQLTVFARDEHVVPRPVDLNRWLEDLAASLRSLVGSHHVLSLDLVPGLGSAWTDTRQLERVVLNLVTNARDASERGQPILVRTEEVVNHRRCVCIAVVDRGEGMDEEVQARIFEPLFTTKAPGVGTGLGLATAHKLVNRLGGCIEVESARGVGSTFRILLPAVSVSTR